MGPKTISRLAILISVVLVASLAIFFIQRYQVTRMAQLVLDDAEKAERDGEFRRGGPDLSGASYLHSLMTWTRS